MKSEEPNCSGITSGLSGLDKMLLDKAANALLAAGLEALEFLSDNPGVSTVELAKRLNRGASAQGLTIMLYRQAMRASAVRETAKDLLLREINAEFPGGWTSKSNVHPRVRIGDWAWEIGKYVPGENAHQFATEILRELTIDHPPPEGWKPATPKDPLIDSLFDRFWPLS